MKTPKKRSIKGTHECQGAVKRSSAATRPQYGTHGCWMWCARYAKQVREIMIMLLPPLPFSAVGHRQLLTHARGVNRAVPILRA
eukprot:53235-Eustigmatos_ZCMA.PRE.1